jgi:hypothetical protein
LRVPVSLAHKVALTIFQLLSLRSQLSLQQFEV